MKEYHKRNPKKSAKRTPEQKARKRVTDAMKNYGISEEEAADLTTRTACDVCGSSYEGIKLCIDHCHESGLVRGVLCNQCNVALGMTRDDPALLRALASYLEA